MIWLSQKKSQRNYWHQRWLLPQTSHGHRWHREPPNSCFSRGFLKNAIRVSSTSWCNHHKHRNASAHPGDTLGFQASPSSQITTILHCYHLQTGSSVQRHCTAPSSAARMLLKLFYAWQDASELLLLRPWYRCRSQQAPSAGIYQLLW